MRTIRKNKQVPYYSFSDKCYIVFMTLCTFDFWFGKKRFPSIVYVGLPIICFIMGFMVFTFRDLPIWAYFLAGVLFLYCMIIFIMRAMSKIEIS